MKNQNKIIVLSYTTFAILIVFVIIYMNNQYSSTPIQLQSEITTKSVTTRMIDIDKKLIFDAMSSIEKYPEILPENYASVKIKDRTNTTIYAQEEVMERGIKIKMLVKHTLSPYEMHKIEVLDGDARGTTITITYEEFDSSTKIVTSVESHLRGALYPFGVFAQYGIDGTVNKILDRFVTYAKNHDVVD